MEFSLTKGKEVVRFPTFEDLIAYIRRIGEIDGWTIRVHHM